MLNAKIIKLIKKYKSHFLAENVNTAEMPNMSNDYGAYTFALDKVIKQAKKITDRKTKDNTFELVIIDKDNKEFVVDIEFCKNRKDYLDKAFSLYYELLTIMALFEKKDSPEMPYYKVAQILDFHPMKNLSHINQYFDWDEYIQFVNLNLLKLVENERSAYEINE